MNQELDAAIELFGIGPIVEAPAPVFQAWSNEVWFVRTVAGAFAVKLFPHQLSEDRRRELRTGVEFEQLVLERGLIPMPRPVTATNGWLVELFAGSGPRLARCHEWVFGDPANPPLGVESMVAAGRYLGRLHAMKRPAGDTSRLPPLDLHRWDQDVHLARQAGLGWADQLADLTPLVHVLATDLDKLRGQRRPMQMSHGDYDPKNALINATGQLVITDWDYAGPVLPDVELGVGIRSFANTDEQILIFVEAYREAGGDTTGSDPLAMAAEMADLDWLLRNVEACLRSDSADTYATAQTLITSLPDDVATARSWPQRLTHLLGQ